MAIWFKITITLNIIYWGVFFYLLLKRRWNLPALAVSVFHMLFAALVSVAPIRSLLDPDYIGYAIGVVHLQKRAVALPAALVLAWALTAAWITVGKGKGTWMKVVMVGDLFFALSLIITILLDGSGNWKFQLGEHFTADGIFGLLILLGPITLPFIASGIWAAYRTRVNGPTTPLAANSDVKREGAVNEDKKSDSFRYSEVRQSTANV